jgi:hypothetical protein
VQFRSIYKLNCEITWLNPRCILDDLHLQMCLRNPFSLFNPPITQPSPCYWPILTTVYVFSRCGAQRWRWWTNVFRLDIHQHRCLWRCQLPLALGSDSLEAQYCEISSCTLIYSTSILLWIGSCIGWKSIFTVSDIAPTARILISSLRTPVILINKCDFIDRLNKYISLHDIKSSNLGRERLLWYIIILFVFFLFLSPRHTLVTDKDH